jgi:nucleotide-binding universal stress UspA family protein
MTKVLAAVDNTAAARSVLAAAVALGDLLDAEVEAIHVREDGHRTVDAAARAAGIPLRMSEGPVVPALRGAGEESDVAALVLGVRASAVGRRPAGHVALQLAVSLPVPLLVVPPQAAVPMTLRRVLVPLDAEPATAAALTETMELARRRKLEVVVLHVHEHASLPAFTDQPQHELAAWSAEFLRRQCPDPDNVLLEVRVGAPGQHVLRVADEIDADLIALGWAQELGEGRAAVIREALDRSDVPLLLVPLDRAEHAGTAFESRAFPQSGSGRSPTTRAASARSVVGRQVR